MHLRRTGNFIVLRGKVKIILVEGKQKREIVLDEADPQRITVPTMTYIGIQNVGDTEAWMLNFPQPAYDPSDEGEQQEMSQEDMERLLSEPSP
jgi:dTDP-4-dehydrorhamnose 3,5-epimerase-like enzyme